MLSVNSESMEPRIGKGDAVIVHRVDPLDVHAGDVVSYRSPVDESVIITHRVVAVDPLTGQVVTKGDVNSSEDPAVSGFRIIGRVAYVVPGVGGIINALHSWLGLGLLIYLPTSLLLASELHRLVRHYLRPTYVHAIYR